MGDSPNDYTKCFKPTRSNAYGERSVQDGDVDMLKGYDFNNNRPLHRLLYQPYAASVNEVTGICRLHIPCIRPSIHLQYDSNPSHVCFSLLAACFDFEGPHYDHARTKSCFLRLDKDFEIDLAIMTTVGDAKPLLLFLGIQFFSCVNRQYLPMRAGGGACIHVVKTGRGVVEP